MPCARPRGRCRANSARTSGQRLSRVPEGPRPSTIAIISTVHSTYVSRHVTVARRHGRSPSRARDPRAPTVHEEEVLARLITRRHKERRRVHQGGPSRSRGRATVLRPAKSALAAVTTATVLVTAVATADAAGPADTTDLQDAVTADAVMDHLAELQKIADNNNDTRAGGTPGYDASVDYVAEALEAAGYEVTIQDFLFNSFRELAEPVMEQVSPNQVTYVPN